MAVKIYTIAFTVVITAFFGAAVSLLHTTLEPKRVTNEKVSQQRVILELFGFDTEGWSNEQIADKFMASVEENKSDSMLMVGTDGKSIPYIYYTLNSEDVSEPYPEVIYDNIVVIPIHGQGFWGPIYGWMAHDNTPIYEILGIDFVKHEETPGLGGRISEKWFKDNFVNKFVLGFDKDLSGDVTKRLKLVSGEAKGEYEVDAITGATETSRAVEQLLHTSVMKFLEVVESDEPEEPEDVK